MFNMNPRVSDSPLDAPRDFKTYCQQEGIILDPVAPGKAVVIILDTVDLTATAIYGMILIGHRD